MYRMLLLSKSVVSYVILLFEKVECKTSIKCLRALQKENTEILKFYRGPLMKKILSKMLFHRFFLLAMLIYVPLIRAKSVLNKL
jgi:hypothetical protein